MIEKFSEILFKCAELDPFLNKIKKGKDAVLCLSSVARPLFVAAEYVRRNKCMLILVSGDYKKTTFSNQLKMYLGPDKVFALSELKEDCQDKFEISKFCQILDILKNGRKKIIVANASSLLKKVNINKSDIFKSIKLELGQTYDRDDLVNDLIELGYERYDAIEGPGTFSVKGDNVEIFPGQLTFPIRIELFIDRVEDIKKFIKTTGQSIQSLNSVELCPCKILEQGTRKSSLFEIFNKNIVVIQDEPRAIIDDLNIFYNKIESEYNISTSKKKKLFLEPSSVNYKNQQSISFVSLMQKGLMPDCKLTLKRPNKVINSENKEKLVNDYKKQGWELFFNLPANMSFLIKEAKIGVFQINAQEIKLGSGQYLDISKNKYLDITQITFPYKPGDYVVHSFYGVAYFKDIVKRKIGDTVRDYLLLEYDGDDKLYLPIEQFERVTKYVGPQGFKPKLTRLGTADWSKVMSKVRKATQKMAFDLVDVYSRRAVAKGFAFSKDNKLQLKMENDFNHLETDDQLSAIQDVKQDMQSSKPMDRLICGDVGFGKTEVAIRAAFKCVLDKKQVMFLCPTTILAQQHYSTFNDRLKKYNVNIDVLSRFKTKKEATKICEDFALGDINILLGTHRLLSRDINPKNLGLVIIDEEQRFGVAHKEQLKNFRESVDVLTLSATPIPRTMQMATSGVRDMSLIMTPPENRRAVSVYVGEWSQEIVNAAIKNEIDRGGQVYYINNKIRTIDMAVKRVGLANSKVKTAVVHGRMNKIELENIMDDFIAGKYDVLVSTTIVENGIDNPNTNTLIIEDAQNLGLSQMYQLKGRVGRSSQQAYAYFLFNNKDMLKQDAVARLEAIDQFSDLGSGLQIAMRDLEIRGAGNFLGAEQSGNITHVGFDLFAQMLKSAVDNAQDYQRKDVEQNKDYIPSSVSSILINLPGSAYLSNECVLDIDQKILWYRKFSCAQKIDEVNMLEKELKNNSEEIDEVTNNFILKTKIAAIALQSGFKQVSIVGNDLVFTGKNLSPFQVKELIQIEGKFNKFSKKTIIPLDRIIDKDDNNLFGQVFDFLQSWEF